MATTKTKRTAKRAPKDGWKCRWCSSTNPAGEVFCKCGALTPALIGIERALADVLGPNDDLAVVWPMLRETGATDDGIRDAIAKALRWYSVTRVVSEPYTACWGRLDPDSGGPRIWFEEGDAPPLGKTPDRDPDFAGEKLIAAVRSIFGIGEPVAKAESRKPKAEKADNPKSKIENPKSPDQVRHLAVSTIRVSSANPRKEFSQHAHTQLVESIKADGLLQPLTVRPAGDGSFELLAGERRLRAAKSAGLKEVPALIRHDVDDAKAARIRLAENYVRENLNPIEEAEAFRALLDEHGFTQRELAEYFGLSQGKIANSVRMMKLPEAWRERVISREITATHARTLATFADAPAVLSSVEVALAEFPRLNKTEPIPADTLEEWIDKAVDVGTRPLSGGYWDRGRRKYTTVRLTKKERERPELDVREVPFASGPELRAFNIALWDELQLAAESRAAERAEKKQGRDAENPKSDTAAERREKANQKAEQYRRRLETWYHEWLRGRIIAKLEALPVMADDSAIFPALSMLLEISADPRELSKLFGGQIEELVRSKVIESLRRRIGECYSDLAPGDVRWIAGRIGVSLETDWAGPTAEFLELHDRSQIAALAKEWGVGHLIALAKTRREEIDELVTAKITGAPPKALTKLVKGLR